MYHRSPGHIIISVVHLCTARPTQGEPAGSLRRSERDTCEVQLPRKEDAVIIDNNNELHNNQSVQTAGRSETRSIFHTVRDRITTAEPDSKALSFFYNGAPCVGFDPLWSAGFVTIRTQSQTSQLLLPRAHRFGFMLGSVSWSEELLSISSGLNAAIIYWVYFNLTLKACWLRLNGSGDDSWVEEWKIGPQVCLTVIQI